MKYLSDPEKRKKRKIGRTGNMQGSLKMQNNIRPNHQIFVDKNILRRNPAVIFQISSNPCLVGRQMPAKAVR